MMIARHGSELSSILLPYYVEMLNQGRTQYLASHRLA